MHQSDVIGNMRDIRYLHTCVLACELEINNFYVIKLKTEVLID